MQNQQLQDIIGQTFAKANAHTKKILGQPMSSSQVIQLINTGKPFTSGFTASTNKNGRPHISWDLFAYWKDTLYMCVSPKSVTHFNLVRGRGVSLVITDGKGSSAVFIEGEAKLVGKANELKEMLLSEIAANIKGFQMPDYEQLIFEIIPRKIFTYKG